MLNENFVLNVSMQNLSYFDKYYKIHKFIGGIFKLIILFPVKKYCAKLYLNFNNYLINEEKESIKFQYLFL